MAGKLRPFVELMRWHKPTGTILALSPSLWSVGLATSPACISLDPKICAIFTCGAVVARGMGCTLNDLMDRKYDRLVERTKNRPLACGALTTKEGLASLALQSTVGLYILCLNNSSVIKLGLFSSVMISSYPLFKRFTDWPQVMLAFTMNWGVLMGYAAVNGSLGLVDLTTVLPVYAGAIFWTLYYDTIYAHQDKTDDMFIGVKSSALALGDSSKKFLYSMAGAMSTSLTVAGLLTTQTWPYYMGILGVGCYQYNQVRRLNLDDPRDCWTAFDRQKYIGTMILISIVASHIIKHRRFISESEEDQTETKKKNDP